MCGGIDSPRTGTQTGTKKTKTRQTAAEFSRYGGALSQLNPGDLCIRTTPQMLPSTN